MIDLSTLKESDIGRKVIYEDYGRRQEGVLTSWNDCYIFARFKGPTGESCRPENLTFLGEGQSK